MYLGGLAPSPDDNLQARTSLYVVPDILMSSYTDGQWNGQFNNYDVSLSSQFMIQTGVGEELLTGQDFTAWVFGIRGDVSRWGFTLTAGYTANGSKDDWQTPYGIWPAYTNMVIGVFDRAQEQTLLLSAAYDFGHIGIHGLNFTTMAAIDSHIADDSRDGPNMTSSPATTYWPSMACQFGFLRSRSTCNTRYCRRTIPMAAAIRRMSCA